MYVLYICKSNTPLFPTHFFRSGRQLLSLIGTELQKFIIMIIIAKILRLDSSVVSPLQLSVSVS